MEKPTKLPSGRWRQRYTGPDGQRYSTTDDSPRKVQKLAALELAARTAEYDRRHVPGRTYTRFDQFAEAWLNSRRPGEFRGYSKVVFRKRLNHLKALNQTFGRMFVEDITAGQVQTWWNNRHATPGQRDTLYWLLNRILKVAVDQDLIHRSPCRVEGAGRKPSKKRPTFTDDDVQKIYAATTDPQFKALWLILMGTALRIGELVALDWEHVELLDARIHVQQHLTPVGLEPGTKTGPEDTRTIILPSWVTEILMGLYGAGDGHGAIFRNTRGGRLSVDRAEVHFRAVREKAGLSGMHLHDLRHVALTSYARQPGVTLADFMAFGGHKSMKVAMSYQHSDQERATLHAQNAVPPRWVRTGPPVDGAVDR